MGCSNTVLEGTAVWRYECTLLQGSMATMLSYNPDTTLATEMEDLTVGKICKRLIQKCVTRCTALLSIQVVLGRNHDTYVLSSTEARSSNLQKKTECVNDTHVSTQNVQANVLDGPQKTK